MAEPPHVVLRRLQRGHATQDEYIAALAADFDRRHPDRVGPDALLKHHLAVAASVPAPLLRRFVGWAHGKVR